MIVPFKDRFETQIIEGTKIHTFREDKKVRYKPGVKLHLATGVRTKNYRLLRLENCKSTQKANIYYDLNGENPELYIDGRRIDETELSEVAKCDGFNSVADFYEFFPCGLNGKIVHWTDKRY